MADEYDQITLQPQPLAPAAVKAKAPAPYPPCTFVCSMPFMPLEMHFSLPIDGAMGVEIYTKGGGTKLCGRVCKFEDDAFSFDQSLPLGECYISLMLNRGATGGIDSLGFIFEVYLGWNKDEPSFQLPMNIPLPG